MKKENVKIERVEKDHVEKNFLTKLCSYYLADNWLRITQDGTSTRNFSGVVELKQNNESWGSICAYHPSVRDLLRICIQEYTPIYSVLLHYKPSESYDLELT